ncbi:P-loop containing nucleoside triphosphate hydrolase protein [Triangularia setosa]|uniref:P-loop containing nucleoside triphosphate hydrolase protein n=1 Tax=Triangularia setosa TaxID=2587417 RepID=A0AAN6WD41_9PEZI|nr:P-loop containing nucleoside triphosphate hydrolase protein [Podospora setosa]
MVVSFVWTPEEASYLKAVLRWQDAPSSDDDNNARPRQPRRRPPPPPQNGQTSHHHNNKQSQPNEKDEPPAGEFRVLVLGAKGAGKSSILTRVCFFLFFPFSQNTFLSQPRAQPTITPGAGESHSCRHPVFLPLPNNNNNNSGQKGPRRYIIDALEFPSNQLSSNPLLEQALAITEAAVIVYDVTNGDSFRLARGVGEFVSEHFNPSSPSAGNNNNSRRVYPVILVANKSDSTERQLTAEEGRQAAEQLSAGGVKVMEASAKSGEGVQGVFEAVGGEILRAKGAMNATREKEMAGGYEKAMAKGVEVARQGGAEGGKGNRGKGGLLRRMFRRQGKRQQQKKSR